MVKYRTTTSLTTWKTQHKGFGLRQMFDPKLNPSTQREIDHARAQTTRSQHNPAGARVTGIESPDDKAVLSVLRSPSRGEGVMLRRIRPPS